MKKIWCLEGSSRIRKIGYQTLNHLNLGNITQSLNHIDGILEGWSIEGSWIIHRKDWLIGVEIDSKEIKG